MRKKEYDCAWFPKRGLKEVKMVTLRKKRKEAGLSMNQVSRMTGISKTAISLYENGHRDLSVKKAKVLAKAYGCVWEELFEDEGDG